MKLVYHYPINLGDGNFNFVALPINENDDVSLVFNVAIQFPSSHTIELYVEILSLHMENVDYTIEFSIDVTPISSQKSVNVDDVFGMNEDDNEPLMKMDSNVVHDMVMS